MKFMSLDRNENQKMSEAALLENYSEIFGEIKSLPHLRKLTRKEVIESLKEEREIILSSDETFDRLDVPILQLKLLSDEEFRQLMLKVEPIYEDVFGKHKNFFDETDFVKTNHLEKVDG